MHIFTNAITLFTYIVPCRIKVINDGNWTVREKGSNSKFLFQERFYRTQMYKKKEKKCDKKGRSCNYGSFLWIVTFSYTYWYRSAIRWITWLFSEENMIIYIICFFLFLPPIRYIYICVYFLTNVCVM